MAKAPGSRGQKAEGMMAQEAPTFAVWVRARRRALGLTQAELAQQAGCATITLRKIEAGALHATVPMSAAIARALAASPDELAAALQLARADEERRSAPANGPAAPPTPLTPLFGRDADRQAISALILGGARLVTLIGPGGIGKTRLALAVLGGLAAGFAGAIYFVDLAGSAAPQQVAAAILQALGVRQDSQQAPLNQLKGALGRRKALLVLDNFEQARDAAPLVAELLGACPQLQVLVTSRSALNVSGEQRWTVPPLAVPDPAKLPPLAAIAAYPAVELFVQRARLLQPGFELSAANSAAVAEICARLDGLPLAIELAAARSSLLDPAALLQMLAKPLPLLTGGPRDLPPRQQTLRAAIAWSYDLLGAGEQLLFRRLAVFTGGWTLAAAEAVGNARSDLPLPLLDLLAALLDQSMINAQVGGPPRFALLETIREFALEQLEASGEAERVRRWHAEYFLALVEGAVPELSGPGSALALAGLAAEQGNIEAVFRWSLAADGAATALRLGSLYWRFCEMSGFLSTGRYWLEAVLRATAPTPSRDLGLVLLGAGRLAWLQGDFSMARAYTERSVANFRALDDRADLPRALHSLALILAALGETEAAATCYGESLDLLRAAGDMAGMARVLNSLGIAAQVRGDFAQAIDLFSQALALQRQLGNTNSVGLLLANLGFAIYEQGDYDRAAALFAESLDVRRNLANRIGMIGALAGLAAVAAQRGDPQRAARLFGAVEKLAEDMGYIMEPDDAAWFERQVRALRASQDEELIAAWAAGREMSLDEALAYAG